MSYLALARKWRPRRFDDVMGQAHVVKALSHALAGDKLHPAILLTGTRGVGKTTLARIVAKGLNCETGVTANPCGACSSCREIDEGRSVDMHEIDAASNTGVDNIRELIENSLYTPAHSRYKVYLIDEVHMLSKGAFNALLKTLEEPPAHIKFILATTDPQKLPVTVLSRCLQFNLKRLPVALIREQLAKVLEAESIAFDPVALTEIGRAADGSMRDGLSLVDQAIAFAGGQGLKRELVEEMLGSVGRQALFEILDALARQDGDALLACLRRLDGMAPDYAALLIDLAAALQRIAVLQLLPQAQVEDDEPAVLQLKGRLGAEEVQLYYQIAVTGRRDMPWAPDPRLGFEMTLLRMLAFRLDEAAAGTAGGPPPVAAARPASTAKPAATSAGPKAAAAALAPVPAQPAPAKSAPAAATKPAPPAAPVLAADAPWSERLEALGLDGYPRQLARNCAWGGREGTTVRLLLDAKLRQLLQEDRRAAIERALAMQLGEALRLEIVVGSDEPVATPAQLEQQRESDRQRGAEQAIETDAGVRAFKDSFGASVRPGSVQPADGPVPGTGTVHSTNRTHH